MKHPRLHRVRFTVQPVVSIYSKMCKALLQVSVISFVGNRLGRACAFFRKKKKGSLK